MTTAAAGPLDTRQPDTDESDTGRLDPAGLDPAQLDKVLSTLSSDGVVGLKGAFDPVWVDQLDEDVRAAFAEARAREGGAVSRGTQRWYVEVHPEQIRGFARLAAHPCITEIATRVLGPAYEIVEVGFDIPFAGALHQPWHRDFPMPDPTRRNGTLTSLAVNVTTVDTAADMGPFEVAPGTHLDDDAEFDHQMFPPKSAYGRYDQRATRRYPQRGDISVRSALTIHRGTANESQLARPVLVLGLDAPGAGNGEHHDTAVTSAYLESLPAVVRDHLHCPVVDRLTPIVQKHTIEGLVMGE